MDSEKLRDNCFLFNKECVVDICWNVVIIFIESRLKVYDVRPIIYEIDEAWNEITVCKEADETKTKTEDNCDRILEWMEIIKRIYSVKITICRE